MYKIANKLWVSLYTTVLAIVPMFLLGFTLAVLIRAFVIGWSIVWNFKGF